MQHTARTTERVESKKNAGCRWLCFCACLLWQWGGVEAARGQEIDRLLAAITEQNSRFMSNNAWAIEYTHLRDYKYLPKGFSENMKNTEVISAKRGNWLMVRQSNIESKKTTWCVWRDNVCMHRIAGTIQISADMHPNLIERSYYTNGLFVNIFDKHPFHTPAIAKSMGGATHFDAFPFGLPESVERRVSKYSVRPARERVDGVECTVLEDAGCDEIWIDPDRGVCLRRVQYYPDGSLMVDYRNKDFREYGDALWLPHKQEATRYNGDNTSAELAGKIRYIEKNLVRKISVGKALESLFDVPPPKRGIIYDHIRGVIYEYHPRRSEDPQDVLNDATDRAKAMLRMPLTGNRQTSVFIGVNLFVVSFLAFVIIVKRRMRRT
ncbi:MAG: hypothetical protein AAF662_04510 [Pseudomonadota bacterium]